MAEFNFTRAKVGRKALVCVAMTPDTEDGGEAYYEQTLLCRCEYDSSNQAQWFSDPEESLQISVASITKFAAPGAVNGPFVILGHNGEVFFNRRPRTKERIPGAGIGAADSLGWGRLTKIRQIGSRLYACGESGQLFVRVREDEWQHLDKSLLRSAADDIAEARADPDGFAEGTRKQTAAILRGEKLELIFYDINGPAEDNILICGNAVGHPWQRGRIYHWNGEEISEIYVRSMDALTSVMVEDEDRIWVCGRSGQLLRGSPSKGFLQVSGCSGDQLFTSMTIFDGKIFLASAGGQSMGLYCYTSDRLERVVSPLRPNIQDVFHVEAVDGVMWTFGQRDITRFDGSTWERVNFPVNPPVR